MVLLCIFVLSGVIAGIGAPKANAATESKEITFAESTNRTRSMVVNIPNLNLVTGISANHDGSASYTRQSSDNILVTVQNGTSTGSQTDPYYYSKTTSKTVGPQSNNLFDSTVPYSDSSGYSGNIGKNGYSYVSSGSYTPEQTSYFSTVETSSNPNYSFPSYVWYNSSGYNGPLYKSGSVYVYSGSDTRASQYFSRSFTNTITNVYYNGVFQGSSSTGSAPSCYSINENGYSGCLSRGSTYGPYISYYYPSYNVTIESKEYTAYYSGTLYKGSDTRVYGQYYWNNLTKPAVDTRQWKQDYQGAVYKAATLPTYSYTVTIHYTVFGPPEMPTNINVTPTTTSASVSWSPSAGATSYLLSVSGPDISNMVCSSSGTSGTCSGLSPGTTYTFLVLATNGYGSNSGSAIATTTTVPGGGTGGGTGSGEPTNLSQLQIFLSDSPNIYYPKLYSGQYDNLLGTKIQSEITHIQNLWNDLNTYTDTWTNYDHPAMKAEANQTANKLRDIAVSGTIFTVTRIKTFIPFEKSQFAIPQLDPELNIVGLLEPMYDERDYYDADDIRIRTEQYILTWEQNGFFGNIESSGRQVFNFNGKSQGWFSTGPHLETTYILRKRHDVNDGSNSFTYTCSSTFSSPDCTANLSAVNGLASYLPNIDYSIGFDFTNSSQVINGYTNGFPAYEIWTSSKSKPAYVLQYGAKPSAEWELFELADWTSLILTNNTIFNKQFTF